MHIIALEGYTSGWLWGGEMGRELLTVKIKGFEIYHLHILLCVCVTVDICGYTCIYSLSYENIQREGIELEEYKAQDMTQTLLFKGEVEEESLPNKLRNKKR